MADDEYEEDGEDLEEVEGVDDDLVVSDPDEDELDDDDIDGELVDDDDDVADEDVADDDEDEDDSSTPAAKRAKRGDDDDDDDDDLLSPDDVEADLDRILKDRMVSSGDDDDDDAEAEADETLEPVSDSGERIEPKRPDEQLCNSCFLLVRNTAPNCPVADDNCPIFS